MGCKRPVGWCAETVTVGGKEVPTGAHYSAVDCDGDGKLDSVCIGNTSFGKKGVLLSTNGCKRAGFWPNPPAGSCKPLGF